MHVKNLTRKLPFLKRQQRKVESLEKKDPIGQTGNQRRMSKSHMGGHSSIISPQTSL